MTRFHQQRRRCGASPPPPALPCRIVAQRCVQHVVATCCRYCQFRSPLATLLTVTRCGAPFDRFQIMSLAEHTVIHEGKLLAGGQLPATLIAGKAGQVEDQIPCPSYPIGGGDAATAFRAFGAEISAIKNKRKKMWKPQRKLLLMLAH